MSPSPPDPPPTPSTGRLEPGAVRPAAGGFVSRVASGGPGLADRQPLLGRENHRGGGHIGLLPAALLLPAGRPSRQGVEAGVLTQRGATLELFSSSSTLSFIADVFRPLFCRSQVQLKKCIPYPVAQAFQAAKAVLSRILSRPRTGLSLYHLRTLLFWACDRLPATYLSCPDADSPGRLLLGLLDDLAHCILGKTCPNYFLPQCNMLEHLTDAQALLVARKLAHVRSDPSEHLRAALDQAQQAGHLKKELTASTNGHGSPGHQPSNGIISPSEDKLAQRLQQLVMENPGKSISVFLNPDDVSRPHFRIDDKFY